MRTTLTTAVGDLADMVGDYLTGTATTAGGAVGATLVDARLKDKSRNTDDYFNDQVIWITAGTSVAGDERYISDFVAASGTVTPYQAFTAQVPNASTYHIFKLWTATEYRNGLNSALNDAFPWVSRNFVDETLATVADTWSYRLGDYGSGSAVTYTSIGIADTGKAWQTNQWAGMTAISGANTSTISSNTSTAAVCSTWSPSTPTSADQYQIIHPITEVLNVAYQPSSTVVTQPYVDIPFEVRDHEGIRIVQLLQYPPVGKTLRIIGRGKLTPFTSTVTSTTEIGGREIKLVYYLAAFHLFNRTPSLSASQDRDFYLERAQWFYGEYEREREQKKTPRMPKRIWHTGMGMSDGDDKNYLAANDTP